MSLTVFISLFFAEVAFDRVLLLLMMMTMTVINVNGDDSAVP